MAFIDSLRLLAATLVLLQHIFEGRDGFVRANLIPLAPGVAGVALFFFISGYVIPMAARNGFETFSFMVRRLFRIYPLYLVAIGLITIAGASGLLPQFASIAAAPTKVWIFNLLLLAEYAHVAPFIGVSWTLAVEILWYGLFAASIVLFGKRAADRLDVLVPAAIVSLAVLSLILGERVPMGRPTMIYAAVLGFQCYRYGFGEIGLTRLRHSIAVFAVVALLANYVAFGVFAHKNLTMMQAIGPWISATTIFLVCVLWRPLREMTLLNTGILPPLGAMSYSIYLLHPLATAIADTYFARQLQVGTAIGLTFVMAWIGYRLVEKPAIALGRRMVVRMTPPQRIVPAA